MNTSTRKLAEACTIDQFLAALSRGREIYTLEAVGAGHFSLPIMRQGSTHQYHLVRADHWDADKHTLGAFRQIEPLKSILFQPREYFGPTLGNDEPESEMSERIVIGVKNCDLAGLRIQDHVFNGLPPGDPRYIEAREKTILVSCDCTDCLDVCFCPVVGEQPYAEKGYDINIAPLSNQYLIDAGSERGEKLLERVSDYLAPAEESLFEEREQCRAAMSQRLIEQSAQHGLRPGMDLAAAVRGAKDSSMWGDFAQDCVECGACNFACCTCHCFQIADGTSDGDPARGKQWDGCLLMNFARVAGGANPRAGRAKRLRNRFEKKFDYFPAVLDCYACDGCGRCTEVCTGNIDIRAVLKRAVDETESLHADSGND
jgi:hypothetical protein